MARKISQEKIEEINRLYTDGKGRPLKEIAMRTGVSYFTVWA